MLQSNWWQWIADVLLVISLPNAASILPGPRDPLLARSAPPAPVCYIEWSGPDAGSNFHVDGATPTGIQRLMQDAEFLVARQLVIDRLSEHWQGGSLREDREFQARSWAWGRSILASPGCFHLAIRNADPVFAPNQRSLLEQFVDPLQVTLLVRTGSETSKLITEFQWLKSRVLEDADFLAEKPALQTILRALPISSQGFGDYLLVTWGRDADEVARLRLSQPAPSLSDQPRFQAAIQKTATQRTSSLVWIDFREMLNAVPRWLGTRGLLVSGMAMSLGLDQLDSWCTQSGIEEGQVVSRHTFETIGPPRTFLAPLQGEPLNPAMFDLIPPDADVVLGGSFSLAKLDAELKSLETRFPLIAPLLRSNRSHWVQSLSLDFDRDIWPALGDQWSLYSSPGYTGGHGLGWVLSVQVNDARLARELADRLAKLMQDRLLTAHSEGAVRSLIDQGRTLFSIQPALDTKFPIAWTMCVTDQQLMLAPTPQALKGHLRFLAERKPAAQSQVTGWRSHWKALQKTSNPLVFFAWADFRRIAQNASALFPWVFLKDDLRWHAAAPSPAVFSGFTPLAVTIQRHATGWSSQIASPIPISWLMLFERSMRPLTQLPDSEMVIQQLNGINPEIPPPPPKPLGGNAGPNVPGAGEQLLRTLLPPELGALIPPDAIEKMKQKAAQKKLERDQRRDQRLSPNANPR